MFYVPSLHLSVEAVISPEPPQPHPAPDQSKPGEWDSWSREQEAKRPRYSEPPPPSEPVPEPVHIPTTTPMPQPLPPKKGPRTPSPPHPASGGAETWDEPSQSDEREGHMWPRDEGKGRGDWQQRTDPWEIPPADGAVPVPEHGDGADGWETTDTWEPGYEEEWEGERVERGHRGPRTPPGEPDHSSSDYMEGGGVREEGNKVERSVEGQGDDDEDEGGIRREEADIFEPLSPEEGPSQRRRYPRQDPEAIVEGLYVT